MSYLFELNHTITELQLILSADDCYEDFLPFQQITIDNKMPIFYDNQIKLATWNHIFGSDMILFHQVDSDLFQNGYFRCVVPIDGFFFIDQFNYKTHYYEKDKSLIFAAAICDEKGNFDFVSNKSVNPFFPDSPIFFMIDDINMWLDDSWDSIYESDEKKTVLFDFMQVFDNSEQAGGYPVCYQRLFNTIQESRIKLHQELKEINPNIYQVI